MADAEQPDAAQEAAADAAEDAKRRFKEALDRKTGKAAGQGGHAEGTSRIHEEHGPAASRRTFRRKAGG